MTRTIAALPPYPALFNRPVTVGILGVPEPVNKNDTRDASPNRTRSGSGSACAPAKSALELRASTSDAYEVLEQLVLKAASPGDAEG